MGVTRILGGGLSVAGLALLAPVLFGGDPVFYGLFGGLLLAVGLVILVIDYRMGRSFARDAQRVEELATRGVRRTGYVRDAVPYSSPHGGAVLGDEGALMVLQIDLDGTGDAARRVTCLVQENSERSRGRIGSRITVLEHPDHPQLRALDGYQPNGRKR